MPSKVKMKIERPISMYKYIKAFREPRRAFMITYISFMALSNLVILKTLNILNTLMTEIAPPDYINNSTIDKITMVPSI